MSVTGKTLGDVAQTYPTLQDGDLSFWERAGVAGKTTYAQLLAEVKADLEAGTFAALTVGGPTALNGNLAFGNQSQARTALGAGATGASVFTASTQAAARSAISASTTGFTGLDEVNGAPLPVGSGRGQWLAQDTGIGNALVAPTGGTWAYFALAIDNSGAVVNSLGGIISGGAQAAGAFSGTRYRSLFWRIT